MYLNALVNSLCY